MNGTSCDVVIVGAGPNGLTAAAVLSRCGLSVVVLERADRIGGSCRTEALTLPGFQHDVCAAIHPMGAVSPVFAALDLHRDGLHWTSAPLPLAHPLESGRAAVLSRDVDETADSLGADGARWRGLMRPFVDQASEFFSAILRPLRVPPRPLLMARFGRLALESCARFVRRFDGDAARALFAGNAAHSFLPLDAAGSASFGLALAVAAHAGDWPCAKGGSQQIVEALAALARRHGCDIRTGVEVHRVGDVPPSRAVMFDLTPWQLERIAGPALPDAYRAKLRRYRYGGGAFKVDYALSAPIPWRARECGAAATVHLGSSYAEIAASEAAASTGSPAQVPFVLIAQQSLFDRSRAPDGAHTAWAYCHVPNGSTVDMTARIEAQLERFAPGFRDLVLARHVMTPAALEAHNPNLVGGDIGGGANTLDQFLFRPVPRWNPYATPNRRLFVCSSATPPGGGVHGMCGYWAARTVLRRVFNREPPEDLRL